MTCTKESPYTIERFDGYSYKVGGLCNSWHGQIYNYTNYTIKCNNRIDGERANSIFAEPKQTTELQHIGYMSGDIEYSCARWSRATYVWKRNSARSYSILMKMHSGVQFISLKNIYNGARNCYIKNKHRKVVLKQNLLSGQISRWVESPGGTFYSNCNLVRKEQSTSEK